MSTFLQRVYDAKFRYAQKTGDQADQLFLGPKEYSEFKQLAQGWEGDFYAPGSPYIPGGPDELMGMTIIGLMSDGLRAGRTVE